ncbi:plasmid replication protein RepC [Rhizobium rhododendri]|uniref:Plasmid replication protein RepC n=1 Tax=Rhizobium rhododendri TaxID=2506430 RepID=A0ABY8IQK7_9HYPH|nr:plasmid replication protein RepC [Rhizobium rhododendri]WFS25458.1 plasmid replication protein RepC [Rhizobium rhododendri]
MHTESVTTPFGRRPVTLALIKRQMAAVEIKPGKSANKWKVFRDIAAGKSLLGLQSSSLTVLNALLSFHPDAELRQDGALVVFPSNVQLALRAHQMSDATIRRHIAALVQKGLIIRKDSANGKRYARKDRSGAIESAFGFDLSPLLARADEFLCLAEEVAAKRDALRKAKADLTICRRNVRKILTAAIEEGAEGNWYEMENTYLGIVRRMSRSPTITEIEASLAKMEMLEADLINRLHLLVNPGKMNGNDSQNDRHIQNSDPDSTIEFEPPMKQTAQRRAIGSESTPRDARAMYPLETILRACPLISDYGPGGTINNWRELMNAAVVVKSMLGVSPSAYRDACELMGPENAAATISCILQRTNFITSAGGYLRSLTGRAREGRFSLGPMIMALLKSSIGEEHSFG